MNGTRTNIQVHTQACGLSHRDGSRLVLRLDRSWLLLWSGEIIWGGKATDLNDLPSLPTVCISADQAIRHRECVKIFVPERILRSFSYPLRPLPDFDDTRCCGHGDKTSGIGFQAYEVCSIHIIASLTSFDYRRLSGRLKALKGDYINAI